MFGLRRRDARDDLISRFHAAIVDASREPALYGEGGLPDTVDGRFESLTLHVLLVLRRLRELPAPAAEVAQELVDAVFSHLEIALRESGVGDFGVPKRMKKIGQAFYDRTARYEAALASGDEGALAAELARRLGIGADALAATARHVVSAGSRLATRDLDAVLAVPFAGTGRPDDAR